MNKLLLLTSSAFFAATSALAAPSIGEPDLDKDIDGLVDALAEPELTVPVENATRVWVDWTQDETTVRIDLMPTMDGEWACTLPANHAGLAKFYIHAVDEAGVAAEPVYVPYEIKENRTDPRGLTIQRYPDISNWPLQTTASSGSLDNGWYGNAYVHNSSDLHAVRLRGTDENETPTATGAGSGGSIRTKTKLTGGLGSLWFKAKMAETNAIYGGEIVLERITYDRVSPRTGAPVYNDDATTVATILVPPKTSDALEWHQFHLLVQDPSTNAVFRLRNTTLATNQNDRPNQSVDLSDIVLAPLIPDVAVYKDEADYAPGFPSIADPIEFHIAVSNRWADAPATHITPRLMWRQRTGFTWSDWKSAYMTNLLGRTAQGDGTYACVLTPEGDGVRAGAFEYFYEVGFCGYAPTFAVTKHPQHGSFNNVVNNRFERYSGFPYLIHQDDLALLTTAVPSNMVERWNLYLGNGQNKKPWAAFLNEGRAPAYCPAFSDVYPPLSHFFAKSDDVVPGSAAAEEDCPWDFTSRFDIRNLDDGWPVSVKAFDLVYRGTDTSTEPVEREIEIELEFPYLTFLPEDGIRRFRTANDRLAVVADNWDKSDIPNGLEAAYPMQNVGDYTWQAIIHVTNAIDVAMSVTSAYHHVAGASEYQAGPFVWVEQNQLETAINPPTSGWVKPAIWEQREETRRRRIQETDPATGLPMFDPDGKPIYKKENGTNVWETYTVTGWSPNLTAETGFTEPELALDTNLLDRTASPRIQIDYDGFLMYRFCTTNGEYQVRRAAWQDFNDWAADINYFSRSFGLYDMQIFESDLEGRQTTDFKNEKVAMSVSGFESQQGHGTDEPSHTELLTDARVWDGFFVRNAWLVQDRRLDSADFDQNLSVRLSTSAKYLGTMETTKDTTSAGRDTWEMRVRSSSDDRVSATYHDLEGMTWDNYFLAVQIQPTEMSDADGAYASIIVCYNDPLNYAEVRLVQRGQGVEKSTSSTKKYDWLELEMWQTVNGVSEPLHPKKKNLSSDYTSNSGTYAKSFWGDNKFFRWPNEKDHKKETGDTYSLTKDWTVGVALSGRTDSVGYTAEVYLWDAGMTMSAEKPPVREPVYFKLDKSLSPGPFGFDVYDVAATFRPWAYPVDYKPEKKNKGYDNTDNKDDCKFKLVMSSGNTSEDRAFNKVQSNPPSYDQNTDKEVGYIRPWTFESGNSSKASGVTRGAPKAYYRLLAYRTEKESTTNSPLDYLAPIPNAEGNNWDADWDEIGSNTFDRVQSVSSLAWKTVRIPMKFWDDTYVKVQALASDGSEFSTGMLCLDDPACDAWRGTTVFDEDYQDDDRNALESWIGTYTAIVEDGRVGRRYELARSRVNTVSANADQTLSTPLLERGVGDILFSYEAKEDRTARDATDTTGGAAVAFEVLLENLRTGGGRSLAKVLALPEEGKRSYYVAGLTNVPGRLVIRTLKESDSFWQSPEARGHTYSPKGTLYVDNLRATDYPNTGSTSWESYNVLVSTFSANEIAPGANPMTTDTSARFDLQAGDGYRSAGINNDPAEGTPPNQTWPDHQPYVQTPSIVTGVGEVSFWYRRAPGETQPGKILLQVAKTQTTPDEHWVPLTMDDLNTNLVLNTETGEWERENKNLEIEMAALEALTNITTDAWTYFSAEFYQQNYNVLRLFGDTNGAGRVLIDNLLITEPVRASIDVGTVEFVPGVPVCTKDTHAIVRLVNPRMNPQRMKVFLDWYVQTGVPQEVELETVQTTWRTNVVSVPVNHYLADQDRWVVASYDDIEITAESHTMRNRTKLPPNLKWGYEAWHGSSGGRRGTLDFTNAPGDIYTFYSTNSIPTTDLSHDAVVQYCVRVEYTGAFAQDVISEDAAPAANVFRFQNPAWYEPIDLNEHLSTNLKQVAHFWNFTVSTNQAFINEIMTAYGRSGQVQDSVSNQFVEVIGGLDLDISDWGLEVAGSDGRYLSPWVDPCWTNRFAQGAKFRLNQKTEGEREKGWGFYVVGNPAVPNANEQLFDDEVNDAVLEGPDNPDNPLSSIYLYAPGALVLRRSMGAYADRVCWGSSGEEDVQDFIDLGYRYLARHNRATRNNPYSLSWIGTRSTGDASEDWDLISGEGTPGLYNDNQEDAIWPLDYELEADEIPLIAQPVITRFKTTDDSLTLSFDVWVTNGIALAADSDAYTWWYETSSTLEGADQGAGTWGRLRKIENVEISAPDNGEHAEITIEINRSSEDPDVNFYRIVALPKQQ